MFQTHPVRMWMEYELPGFQKPLAILTFYLNPQKTIVPRIRGPPYEWSSYSLYGMGLEDPNATVQWTVACCRLDSSNTLVAVHSRTAMQTSPFRRTNIPLVTTLFILTKATLLPERRFCFEYKLSVAHQSFFSPPQPQEQLLQLPEQAPLSGQPMHFLPFFLDL